MIQLTIIFALYSLILFLAGAIMEYRRNLAAIKEKASIMHHRGDYVSRDVLREVVHALQKTSFN